jgi:uncharacterized protein YcbK (DUF882 family)
MKEEMVSVLQEIRNEFQLPIFISSGYRCTRHPAEQDKDSPGEHTFGMAVDIMCFGSKALKILSIAQSLNIKRIGLHQKGNVNGRFVHIGIANRYKLEFPEAIWTY